MKAKLILTITLLCLLVFHAYAQPPQAFRYQAIARDASGNPFANTQLKVRAGIHDLSQTGTLVYQETQTVTTNSFGLVNISIGTGVVTSGVFTSINWGTGSKYMEVEIDFGAGYVSLGNSELLSVPYALYAPSAKGDTGTAGTNGYTWYSGNSIPSSGTGVNGDYYLNTATGDVYLKSSGNWNIVANITGPSGAPGVMGATGPAGVTGAAGTNGTNGYTWYSGNSIPSSSTGVNGDYYLNTATGDVYLKGSGSWSITANITGPAGAMGSVGATGPPGTAGTNGTNGINGTAGTNGTNGTNGYTWYSGSSVPVSGTGVNGDYYLNTVTGDVYLKSSGNWSIVANITGPTGAPGSTGAIGAAGTNGTNGINGTNGYTWYSGSSVPASGTGVNGDYFLNTATGDVYLKSGGSWSITANITGPTGAPGSAGATGPAGATGATGPNGTNGIAGTNGTNGTNGYTWYSGSSVPASGTGVNGDYYLNTATGDVYLKGSGSWSITANIKGPNGTAGTNGTNGINGTAGTNGTNGYTWYSGSSIPSSSVGVNGDYYLNTATGDVYLKSSGNWSIVANIKGPTGAPGSAGATGPAGATGATGPNGTNGIAGTNGTNGTNGYTWYSGSSVPASGTGVNGDYYLNTATGDVYLKGSGSWSITANIKGPNGTAGTNGTNGINGTAGTNGTNGTNGYTWYSGSSVPVSGTGVNGDYYLNTATGDVYLKGSGSWSITANIKGPNGTAGTNGANGINGTAGTNGTNGTNGYTWYSGSSVPVSGTGVNGDYYLNTATGDVYLKSSGNWSIVANITGPTGAPGSAGATGPAGATGATGPNGTNGIAGTNGTNGTNGYTWYSGSSVPASGTGVNGDYYLNTATGDVYLKGSGSWSITANIKGPNGTAGTNGTNGINGTAGTNGTNGTNGYTWYSGSSVPVSGTGVNGDYYLNTATGDVYLKGSGSWSITANIKGPNGTAGTNGANGINGTAGTNGTNGTNGYTWYSGSSVPVSGTGVNGDYYLNIATGDVYLKGSGNWSITANIKGPNGTAGTNGTNGINGTAGTNGTNGTNGYTWYSGSSVPVSGTGVNGDYYLNTATGDVYLKSSGNWSIVANITGPTGAPGSAGATGPAGATGATGPNGTNGIAGTNGTNGTNGYTWYSGSSVPASGTGVNGDYYLNTATGDVYLKSGGGWSIVANITGPTGAPGSAGATGPAGATGATGPIGATGTNGTNGIAGTNGTNGTNGYTWYSGSVVPVSGTGVNGDYYLNTATGDVYLKSSGNWSIVANITGPTGAPGSTGATGPAGATGTAGTNGTNGINGTAGTNGANGTNGYTWYSGSIVPASSTGGNGDYYLNTATGDVYLKSSGNWSIVANITGPTGAPGSAGATGPAGATGATGPIGVAGINGTNGIAGTNGTNGYTWYSGSVVPASGTGVNGDYYLNTATGDVYLKSGGNWSITANIKGPTGAPGSTGAVGPAGATGTTGTNGINGINGTAGTNGTNGINGYTWYSGNSVPASGIGVNGDYYLNTATGDVYLKSGGNWSIVANITGPTGALGSAGATGPAGATGATGPIGVAGTNGTNGIAGTNGTNGYTWYSGSSVPVSGTGVNGDYYLNTATGDVYLKSGGSWSIVANIKGPTGAAGSVGATGSAGATGATGPIGATGTNGTNGIAGTNGTNGTNGYTWYSGSIIPASGTGVNGDYYLNTATGDVYLKNSGSWSITANIKGPTGAAGTNAVVAFADFYALMPSDNSATIAVGTAVAFPQNGPSNNVITRSSSSTTQFVLPSIGTYMISWEVSISEAGQLVLELNGTEIPATVVGRATGTSQITGNRLITTTSANSILRVVNPSGNSTALTITTYAGGAQPVSASLVITRIQ